MRWFSSAVALAFACAACVDLDGLAKPAEGTSGGLQPPPTQHSGCAAAAGHRFCDDFDARDAVDSELWSVQTSGGGLSIDRVEAASRPGSLYSAIKPDPSGARCATYATIEKEVVLTGSRAHLELDLRLDAEVANIQSLAYLLSVGLKSGDYASLAIQGGKVRVMAHHASGVWTLSLPLDPFPVGAWTHVVMEITFSQREGSVFVSSDGKVLVDSRALPMSSAVTTAGTFVIAAGANGIPEDEVRLHFDNLVIE